MPQRSSSSLVLWLLGGGLIFAFCVIAGVAVLFLGRSVDTRPTHVLTVTPVTVFSDTPTATAPASAIATASASVAATATSQAPISLADAEREQLEGSYTCSMDNTPSFTCRVTNGILEKTGGSQRFKGPITKLSNGNLSFSGSFFCPFGDCTHPIACTFTRLGPGHYACNFGPNSVPGGGPGGEHVSLLKVR